MLHRREQLPRGGDIREHTDRLAAPSLGSLWLTARGARIGAVAYEHLPAVPVAILAAESVDGVTWLHAVPFMADAAVARVDEIVLSEVESSLEVPLRFAIKHRLRLRRERLARPIGFLEAGAAGVVRSAVAGGSPARRCRRGAHVGAGATTDDVAGRPDPAVLMVLQRPWWNATGRGAR